MLVRRIVEPERLALFFSNVPELHLYSIGDLDEKFWPWTEWWGCFEGEELLEVVLLYRASEPPTLLALTAGEPGRLGAFLRETASRLPGRMYAHLTPGVMEAASSCFHVKPGGLHLKMALRDRSRCQETMPFEAIQLGLTDLPDLLEFYADAYPGNWFNPRMLETGQYLGIREGGRLLSVAGVHVYSPRYRVAALGNITTHPRHRGRGLARAVTAALCRRLLKEVEWIGLNVAKENEAAQACYRSVGFEVVAVYEEAHLVRG